MEVRLICCALFAALLMLCSLARVLRADQPNPCEVYRCGLIPLRTASVASHTQLQLDCWPKNQPQSERGVATMILKCSFYAQHPQTLILDVPGGGAGASVRVHSIRTGSLITLMNRTSTALGSIVQLEMRRVHFDVLDAAMFPREFATLRILRIGLPAATHPDVFSSLPILVGITLTFYCADDTFSRVFSGESRARITQRIGFVTKSQFSVKFIYKCSLQWQCQHCPARQQEQAAQQPRYPRGGGGGALQQRNFYVFAKKYVMRSSELNSNLCREPFEYRSGMYKPRQNACVDQKVLAGLTSASSSPSSSLSSSVSKAAAGVTTRKPAHVTISPAKSSTRRQDGVETNATDPDALAAQQANGKLNGEEAGQGEMNAGLIANVAVFVSVAIGIILVICLALVCYRYRENICGASSLLGGGRARTQKDIQKHTLVLEEKFPSVTEYFTASPLMQSSSTLGRLHSNNTTNLYNNTNHQQYQYAHHHPQSQSNYNHPNSFQGDLQDSAHIFYSTLPRK